jgi:hypothetical protein
VAAVAKIEVELIDEIARFELIGVERTTVTRYRAIARGGKCGSSFRQQYARGRAAFPNRRLARGSARRSQRQPPVSRTRGPSQPRRTAGRWPPRVARGRTSASTPTSPARCRRNLPLIHSSNRPVDGERAAHDEAEHRHHEVLSPQYVEQRQGVQELDNGSGSAEFRPSGGG